MDLYCNIWPRVWLGTVTATLHRNAKSSDLHGNDVAFLPLQISDEDLFVYRILQVPRFEQE
jgi:hypothetical protein